MADSKAAAAAAAAGDNKQSGGKVRCLVAGATGAIGKEVVEFLLVREEVQQVTVLVRRANAFPEHANAPAAKFVEKVVDYERLNADDFRGYDVVVCCLGSTIRKAGSQAAFTKIDVDAIQAVATHAKAGGARHFALVSSVGADHTSSTFYLRVKGQSEEFIKALQFPEFYCYRPSVLEADRAETRCGESVGLCMAKWLCCWCLSCCCSQYSAIHVRTVALAIVKNALFPTKTGAVCFDGSGAIEAVAHAKSK